MNLEPARRHYWAIFAVSLALLMLEIVIARVLSVALASHYALVAISLAMFGIGLSGLIVYLFPDHFTRERLDEQLASYAAWFGLSTALSVVAFLHLYVVQEFSLAGFLTLSLAYGVLALPFICAGICISLLMTHFSARIGRIYWADLAGASAGCLAVVGAMQIAPAPQVAVVVALLATIVALLIALRAAPRMTLQAAIAVGVVAAVVVAAWSTDLVRMRYVKRWDHFYSEAEAWNAFSRVSAFPSPRNAAQLLPLRAPSDENIGPGFPQSMILDIDGTAWTPMGEFDGDLLKYEFLRQSVVYVAHHLRANANVLIIGPGGGRDILAAKVFDQPSILAIEINPLMRYMVEERFRAYSGGVYSLPGVEVIIDEARSRLSTLDRKFDIIQLSLIDTFSLNAAGGFVFNENYLYTKEAFQEYFRHLDDDGVLVISRYLSSRYPLEMLKVVVMMREAWEAEGVEHPENHIAVLSQWDTATVLAKRTPFEAKETELLKTVARDNGMGTIYMPLSSDRDWYGVGELLTSADLEGVLNVHPFLIGPATDDRPFFFHFLRGRLAAADIPGPREDPFQFMRQWHEALLLLYMLLAVVTMLAAVFFIGPLLLFPRRGGARVHTRTVIPLLSYFACLGYGFMMIEVPLLQRFVLLLGYPVYALAVVLFALLLSSCFGSLLSVRFATRARRSLGWVLAAIVAIVLAYDWLLPSVVESMLGAPLALRMALTVVLLAPVGLLMGMPYPLGITVLREFGEGLVPWAWALNGALSVVASVLAIFLGSRYGFSVALLTGGGAYAAALAAMAIVGWQGGASQAGA
jgi:spermidine synthase